MYNKTINFKLISRIRVNKLIGNIPTQFGVVLVRADLGVVFPVSVGSVRVRSRRRGVRHTRRSYDTYGKFCFINYLI